MNEQTGAGVGDSKKPKLAFLNRGRVVFGLAIIIVVISGGTLAYYQWFKSEPKPKAGPTFQMLDPTKSSDSEKLIDNAKKTDISKYQDPQKVAHYYSLAAFYIAKGDYGNGLTNLKLGLAITPDDPSMLESAGLASAKLGQKDQAKIYYQKAITQYQKLGKDVPGTLEKIDQINEVLKTL